MVACGSLTGTTVNFPSSELKNVLGVQGRRVFLVEGWERALVMTAAKSQ